MWEGGGCRDRACFSQRSHTPWRPKTKNAQRTTHNARNVLPCTAATACPTPPSPRTRPMRSGILCAAVALLAVSSASAADIDVPSHVGRKLHFGGIKDALEGKEIKYLPNWGRKLQSADGIFILDDDLLQAEIGAAASWGLSNIGRKLHFGAIKDALEGKEIKYLPNWLRKLK